MPEPEAGAAAPARTAPLLAFGLDYGERRIGVAVGDTLTGSARPLGTVPAIEGRPEWPVLERYLHDWQPRVLVVGVPLNMDDTPGPLTAAALGFAADLRARYGLEVVTLDERLSSR